MSDINVSSEYKKIREKQKESKRKKEIGKTFLTVIALIVVIAGVIAVLFATGAFSGGDNTIVPPPTTNETASPILTPSTTPNGTDTAVTQTPIVPSTPNVTKTPSVVIPTPDKTPTPTPSLTPDKTELVKKATRVFIDAGHGCENSVGTIDNGAGAGTYYYNLSGGWYEKDLNLAVAMELKDILLSAGYEVIMLRESDVLDHVTLAERAYLANSNKCDVYISIHANSAAESAYGSRVIYYSGHSVASESKKFAQIVNNAINNYKDATVSRRESLILDQNLQVCRDTLMPAVLVETTFMTNKKDAELATNGTWYRDMALALSEGIKEYAPLRITYE